MGGCPDHEPGCFISYFILFTHPIVFIKMQVESMCQISVMKIKLKAKAFISCLTSIFCASGDCTLCCARPDRSLVVVLDNASFVCVQSRGMAN